METKVKLNGTASNGASKNGHSDAAETQLPGNIIPGTDKVNEEKDLKAEQGKPALNLEGTLKLVADLHRKKMQREKLINTISNFEAFEIEQQDDAEENGGNRYQRCELSITDDKGNEFVTKNAHIIQATAQYIKGLCVDKLAEVEAGIIIPA
jgi:hypothetical protein